MALVSGYTLGLKQCLKDFAALRQELSSTEPEQTLTRKSITKTQLQASRRRNLQTFQVLSDTA